jgi:hypothetical protein
MTDETHARPPSRAWPVSEPSLEASAAQAEELARRWVVALVTARPVRDLGALPLDELAGKAPALCRQLLLALSSESELDRLLSAPGTRGVPSPAPVALAALSGARGPSELADVVEALRGAAWELLRDELASTTPDSRWARAAGELSDRLAHVCSRLLAAALAAEAGASAAHEEGESRAPEAGGGGDGHGDGGRGQILIVDERFQRESPVAHSVPHVPRLVDPPAPAVEIEIRDARSEHGPGAWIGSIGHRLESFEQDGLPFAVILMEVEGISDASLLERVLGEQLRAAGGGTLTMERAGRYWLLVPRADRIGAHALASRLEQALLAAGRDRGMTVDVHSGTAVCPEDGRQASMLAAHADIGLYAARWEARSAGVGGQPADEFA